MIIKGTEIWRREVSVSISAERKVEQVVSAARVSVEVTVPQTMVGKCYVVDGDTIRIGNVAMRLAGIVAPELDHPYRQKAKWRLANTRHQRLDQLQQRLPPSSGACNAHAGRGIQISGLT